MSRKRRRLLFDGLLVAVIIIVLLGVASIKVIKQDATVGTSTAITVTQISQSGPTIAPEPTGVHTEIPPSPTRNPTNVSSPTRTPIAPPTPRAAWRGITILSGAFDGEETRETLDGNKIETYSFTIPNHNGLLIQAPEIRIHRGWTACDGYVVVSSQGIATRVENRYYNKNNEGLKVSYTEPYPNFARVTLTISSPETARDFCRYDFAETDK
jgi:hypothetical protein